MKNGSEIAYFDPSIRANEQKKGITKIAMPYFCGLFIIPEKNQESKQRAEIRYREYMLFLE